MRGTLIGVVEKPSTYLQLALPSISAPNKVPGVTLTHYAGKFMAGEEGETGIKLIAAPRNANEEAMLSAISRAIVFSMMEYCKDMTMVRPVSFFGRTYTPSRTRP